ncbi:hypothetical protein NC99_30120 [Sunxiuqinia dokdonensis]|uniref:Uncharacterized protein n=1 Tax=Sunxiuqinia dokdonensis TaxID=1409788 RepID=A0A0L8V6Z7_9BACT|nr:hypothetical protein NC99_30120 [Sunxiuqinia dokdonensis]
MKILIGQAVAGLVDFTIFRAAKIEGNHSQYKSLIITNLSFSINLE